MTNENDFLVTVRRHPMDWQTAEVKYDNLSNLRWDCESGGVQAPTPYMMIFGYMFCDQIESGELAHSCSHGPPPHQIKVCLIKKYNQEHWKKILIDVGPKPLKNSLDQIPA